MTPKKFVQSRTTLRIAALTTAMALAGVAFGQTQGTACPTGTSTFKTPKHGIAFLSGTAGISAPVSLKDNGCTLWTYSRRAGQGATGLDVQKHYHTLVYDDQSVATGANACIPSVNWLAVNVLNPNPFGLAYDALAASVPGSVYALDALGTVSIRRHDQTGPVVNLALVACGAIAPDTRRNPPQPPGNC